MNKSKYEKLAGPAEAQWNRYGLSESEWMGLSTEDREIHYNRWRVTHTNCDHPYDGSKVPEALRGAYSFDPYYHTAHMIPHSIEKFFQGTCPCQTCQLGFGIERGTEKRKINEEQLKEKLRNRQKHVECFCEACWKKKPIPNLPDIGP